MAQPWVAPIFRARSIFDWLGSIAMTARAPASAAPWIAPEPTPPQPITTTTSPGFTSPRSTAEPKPVEMPQQISAAARRSYQGSILISEASCTTMYSENVPSWLIRLRFSLAEVVAPGAVRDHRARQDRRAQVAEVLAARDAPLALAAGGDERHRDVVAGLERRDVLAHGLDDARALVAADDREHRLAARDHLSTSGRMPMSPWRRCSSEWHMPAKAILTFTSWAWGSSISMSSVCHGP